MTARPTHRFDLTSVSLKAYWVVALSLCGFTIPLLSTYGCSGAGAGYRAAYKAAKSEHSAKTLARDERLKLHLREAILLDQTYSGLSISPYVYMERGFVVGLVETEEQAKEIERAARAVKGLRSLYAYLPVQKKASEKNQESGGSPASIAIKAEIKANFTLVPDITTSQIAIQVLDGNVVLLGVVASERIREEAEREAFKVSGIKDVTNLLLLPESGYMKRFSRPHLLR